MNRLWPLPRFPIHCPTLEGNVAAPELSFNRGENGFFPPQKYGSFRGATQAEKPLNKRRGPEDCEEELSYDNEQVFEQRIHFLGGFAQQRDVIAHRIKVAQVHAPLEPPDQSALFMTAEVMAGVPPENRKNLLYQPRRLFLDCFRARFSQEHRARVASGNPTMRKFARRGRLGHSERSRWKQNMPCPNCAG